MVARFYLCVFAIINEYGQALLHNYLRICWNNVLVCSLLHFLQFHHILLNEFLAGYVYI